MCRNKMREKSKARPSQTTTVKHKAQNNQCPRNAEIVDVKNRQRNKNYKSLYTENQHVACKYGNMHYVKQQHVTGFDDRTVRAHLNTAKIACKTDYQIRTLYYTAVVAVPPFIQSSVSSQFSACMA